jgi:hypothetical protein
VAGATNDVVMVEFVWQEMMRDFIKSLVVKLELQRTKL